MSLSWMTVSAPATIFKLVSNAARAVFQLSSFFSVSVSVVGNSGSSMNGPFSLGMHHDCRTFCVRAGRYEFKLLGPINDCVRELIDIVVTHMSDSSSTGSFARHTYICVVRLRCFRPGGVMMAWKWPARIPPGGPYLPGDTLSISALPPASVLNLPRSA